MNGKQKRRTEKDYQAYQPVYVRRTVVERVVGYARGKTLRLLAEWKAAGKIRCQGRGPGARYHLGDIYKIISE